MIDIHCHILPGIDDGAQTIEDSIAMAKQAVREGITTIIATPHHRNGKYENSSEKVIEQTNLLNERLKQDKINLHILPGQEPRIYGEILQAYKDNDIITLNQTSKYLFLELPSNHVPRYTEQLIYDLQLVGLTPIIVHPERNGEITENSDILYQLVKKGALTQVTAASITGGFGNKIRKFTLQLIEANLTHFVASDAHNITTRSFRLREAYEEIEKKYGTDLVYLFTENAELLVNGQTVFKEVPERVKRKKFLGIF